MKKDLTVFKAILKADYDRHRKWFANLKKKNQIILFGDSLVAYFPVKAYNLEETVQNLGIPGDQTLGLLNRLEDVVRLKPKAIIIHVGSNDLVLTESTRVEIANRILSIRQHLQLELPNTPIYVVSILPVLEEHHLTNKNYLLWRNNGQIKEVNTILEKQIESPYYLDLYADLLDDQERLNPELTTDGLHLNEKGYQIYFNHIQSLLVKE